MSGLLLQQSLRSTMRGPTMRTQTIQGVDIPAHDAAVLDAIDRAARAAASGPTTVVGIRNIEGSVYRVVHAVGVAESLALTDGLEALGLVDDRQELERARQGCDSIFGVPRWLSSRNADET